MFSSRTMTIVAAVSMGMASVPWVAHAESAIGNHVEVEATHGVAEVVSPGPIEQVAAEEGNVRLTTEVGELGLSVDSVDSSIEGTDDGGVVVKGRSGEFLLAVSAPTLLIDGGRQVEGRWSVDGDTIHPYSSEVTLTPDVEVQALLGKTLISKVTKDSYRSKPRWSIYPSALGRVTPVPILAQEGWKEVRAKGGVPDTLSLKNQYICHPMSELARAKPTWNIEAVRDASNMAKTLAAGCNP